MSSYHDLHITTSSIERTSIFNLPHNHEVRCNRVTGWELWETIPSREKLLAGEYAGIDRWLVLDVDGAVIVDSRPTLSEAQARECNGLCVMASELIGGVAPDLVAHAHPDCELHGDDAGRIENFEDVAPAPEHDPPWLSAEMELG